MNFVSGGNVLAGFAGTGSDGLEELHLLRFAQLVAFRCLPANTNIKVEKRADYTSGM